MYLLKDGAKKSRKLTDRKTYEVLAKNKRSSGTFSTTGQTAGTALQIDPAEQAKINEFAKKMKD